eukprot:761254-Hanusia_phi.AAC.2
MFLPTGANAEAEAMQAATRMALSMAGVVRLSCSPGRNDVTFPTPLLFPYPTLVLPHPPF